MPARRFRGQLRRRNMGLRPRRRRRRAPPKTMTVRKVRRIIGAELKRQVFGINGVFPAVDGFVFQATDIGIGTSVTQRVGDWISPAVMHGTIQVNAVHGISPAIREQMTGRIVIFTFKEDSADGDPTVSDIVNNDTSPNGQFNFVNRGQFKVLYTRTFSLVADHDSPFFTNTFKYYLRLGSHPKITFNGTITKQNHIYILLFSDVDTADPAVPEFRLDNVIRYTDG